MSILHAHAMCYAASYNPTTIVSRVWTALERAFAIDQRGGVNRIDNARPAFTWSMTNYGNWKHVMIAIEGTTSPHQHVSRLDRLNNSVQVDLDLGRTLDNFKDYADDIYGIITTAPFSPPNIMDASTRVTFAGYSLGAAVADLLANKWAKAFPTRTTRLIKFASPKVADAVYYNTRPRRIQAVSVHRLGDDMWTLPAQSAERSDVGGVAVPTNFLRFVNDPAALVMDWRGQTVGGFPEETVQRRINFVLTAGRNFSDPTTVFQHLNVYYRQMMNMYAERLGAQHIWAYRYLEFNDENRWQASWEPGEFPNAAWNTILGTAPDAYDSSAISNFIRGETEAPRTVAPAIVRPRLEDLPQGYHVIPRATNPQSRRQRTNPIGS